MNNIMNEIEMINENFLAEDHKLKIQNFIKSPNKYNINKNQKKTVSRKHLEKRKTNYNSFFKKASYSRKKKFTNLSKDKSKKKKQKTKFENFVLNGNNIKKIKINNDYSDNKKKNFKNKFIVKNKENFFKRENENENFEERFERKSSKHKIYSIKNYKYDINVREEKLNERNINKNFKNRAEIKVYKYPIKSKYMLKNLKINLNKLNEKKKKVQNDSPNDKSFLNINKLKKNKRNKILRLPPKNFKNKKVILLKKSRSSKDLIMEDLKSILFENLNFEDYQLFSKKISQENFLLIISNFNNYYQGKEDINLICKNLFKKKIEWFYSILIKKENNNNDVKNFLPISIAIWNLDLKNSRTNRILLEKVFLLNKNEDLLKYFLDLLTKKIFSNNKIYVDEIYWKLKHKKIEGKFISPNREFIKNLKKNLLWKWKMVLNTDKERFTVLAKVNLEKKLNQKDFSFVKIFISNLITYKEKIKIFNKRKIIKINFLREDISYYMLENFNESLKFQNEIKNEMEEILKKDIEMVKISDDQNLLTLFQQILKKKNLKDRNLKDLCFQTIEPENCKLYYFLQNIRVVPLITKNEIIYNKKIKISRIEYEKKIKDKNIYFIKTLDNYIKIVIAKCEKSFNEERIYKNISNLILQNLNNNLEETENSENLKKKFLWLPNFKISKNFSFNSEEKKNIFSDVKEFKKYDFNFEVPLIENRIVIKPDTNDKWIKSEFLFSIFKVDLENDKFVPVCFFKVSRKNFIK